MKNVYMVGYDIVQHVRVQIVGDSGYEIPNSKNRAITKESTTQSTAK